MRRFISHKTINLISKTTTSTISSSSSPNSPSLSPNSPLNSLLRFFSALPAYSPDSMASDYSATHITVDNINPKVTTYVLNFTFHVFFLYVDRNFVL